MLDQTKTPQVPNPLGKDPLVKDNHAVQLVGGTDD